MIRPILTQRAWHHRLLDTIETFWAQRSARMSLRDLDRRTLADIGVDPSEIDSIEAEATERARLTRLRIAVAYHHG